ncbi:ATP-binding protein [Elioraea rosea]|uniref:ATP-binding protein n=1 Tax=Elioraea rosea TaxID=2492390 RepID=UPI0011831602|nr:winged helix-turn-helix domain-containing protein [Elioraea rosea]
MSTTSSRKGFEFGPFRLFPAERLLERDGKPVPIGSRAFDLLTAMAERAGEVVSKSELFARGWPGMIVEESGLRFHVSALRKALEEGKDGARYIANVPGRGYCLVVPATAFGAEVQRPPAAARSDSAIATVSRGLPLGREDTVPDLMCRLGRDRLVTVSGPAGIGKTTVAFAVAAAERDRGAREVRIVDLAGGQDPALVGAAVAASIGISARSEDPTNEILGFLADRPVLLVLDNCEHVLTSVAPLAERLYLEAPSVQVLVTSREPLRVLGEHVVELPPLPVPPRDGRVTADVLLAYPATKLFLDRAAAVGFREEVTDEAAATIAALCRKLDGIALAIELVASRVGMLGLAETAALVDTRLRLLWQGRRTAPPRHQTLAAALDWSHALLSENERRTLRKLSVFAGTFSLSAALAVAGADMEETDAAAALDSLVSRSLVAVRRDDGAMRYRLLDTTRAYAAQKLEASGEAASTARRHAAAVLAILTEERAGTSPEDRAARRARERALLGDVQTALRWSFADLANRDLSIALAAHACSLFIALSLLHECRQWSSAALALAGADELDDRTALALQAALGHALTFIDGNDDAARDALERALLIAEGLADREEQFRLLGRLHMFHRRADEVSRLLPIAVRMQEIGTALGDPAGMAAAHTMLGVSFHLAGDQGAARLHLETALGMAEFERVTPGHFAFHRNPIIALARTLWLQGCPDKAVEAARPLASDDASADVVTRCIGLIWGADVFRWTGDWATFQALAERLDTLAVRHSLRPYQAVALGMRGEALIRSGQARAGTEFLRSALKVLQAHRYELYMAGFGSALAEGLALLGRAEEAIAFVGTVLKATLTRGSGLHLAELYRIRAGLHAALGDAPRAQADFRTAIATARAQGAVGWELRAATGLARLCGHAAALQDALSLFEEGFETSDLGEATEELARLRARTT